MSEIILYSIATIIIGLLLIPIFRGTNIVLIKRRSIKIRYKNWRGEISEREIVPIKIFGGETEWHPEWQWFMKAFDIGKGEIRDFALLDMTILRKE